MVNKFSNTKAYMASFSDKLIKLLRMEITRQRRRTYIRSGISINSPINNTGTLAKSLEMKYSKSDSGFSFDISGMEYGRTLNDGGVPKESYSQLVSNLASWIKNKPVTLQTATGGARKLSDAAIPALANNIARKISTEGVKATGFIDQALAKAMQNLDDIGDPIVKDVALNIDEILIKAGFAKKGDKFIIE